MNEFMFGPKDIDYIIDHKDGTSTIKYIDGTRKTVPTKEADKLAVMLNRELKSQRRMGKLIV